MSVAVFPSEPELRRARTADALAGVRVVGGTTAAFSGDDGSTRLVTLAESGGYRLKFPDPNSATIEAVIINTGGGVAGGDHMQFDFAAEQGARVVVSSATAERVYRSTGPASEVDVRLAAGSGARLGWLPQASILFSGARLKRRFEVDLAGDAQFLIAEATVFGRIASGEVLGGGLLHDVWRVRREGRLVFAEATRIDGEIAEVLARPAAAGEARVMALLLAVAPEAEDYRDRIRAALADCPAMAGVSAWNGLLVMRALANRLDQVQNVIARAVTALAIVPVPQVWSN